jgi:hypothetical protein
MPTKHTLFGIVLFKLNIFSRVRKVPSIDSTCSPHMWGFQGIVFFLLSTDSTYSRVPGDQGGPIFFSLRIFLVVVLCTNWCTTICITCPIVCKIECNEVVCNEFVLVLVQIDRIQSVL